MSSINVRPNNQMLITNGGYPFYIFHLTLQELESDACQNDNK